MDTPEEWLQVLGYDLLVSAYVPCKKQSWSQPLRGASLSNSISPGFIALHGNRAEDLAQTVIDWLHRQPLGLLEEEVVLVGVDLFLMS